MITKSCYNFRIVINLESNVLVFETWLESCVLNSYISRKTFFETHTLTVYQTIKVKDANFPDGVDCTSSGNCYVAKNENQVPTLSNINPTTVANGASI